ncbi:MAG TPA: glycosyl hydrolase family 28-related protein [Armatimonadota bacterium]|nr:glycosyl hydrolase family 28-related protein [Armatimonadota bacterium]
MKYSASALWLLCALLLGALPGARAQVGCTAADPAYASRALAADEMRALAAHLQRRKAAILALAARGELPAFTGARLALAEALARGGATEAAETARTLRVLHGPPALLDGIRAVERAHNLAIYALNLTLPDAPVVILNGGADLRATLLHETFALTYPALAADEVAKKAREFEAVTARAAYMAYLRQHPDTAQPGFRAWLYGRAAAGAGFSQQFWAKPGAEWQRGGKGGGSFTWKSDGFLEVTTKGGAGGVDEYCRVYDVPALTERDAVTFSGYFTLHDAAFGAAKRATLVYGLGSFLLHDNTRCRGLAVALDGTPAGASLRAVIAPGQPKLEIAGKPVPLKPRTLYGLQARYAPAADGTCALTVRVIAADGGEVGVSTASGPVRAGFFADRLFLGNDPRLPDGTLVARWYSVAVEPGAVGLFRTPLYQSPSRVDAGDLVQCCGSALSEALQVVYQRVPDLAAVPAAPPAAAQSETTAEHGRFALVSAKGAPFSLVAQAPPAWKNGEAYALWVGAPERGWSAPALVNAPRPAWISPSFAFAGNAVSVVGRNLDPLPADAGTTQVRLRGPATYTLPAANDGRADTAIETYRARVTLPADAKQGVYTVEVCRDGTNWVLLEGRTLTIFPPLPPLQRFDVTQYGATPNDETDDTGGIQQAIIAAAAAGNGEVYLPPGNFISAPFVLTRGVSLAGAGLDQTRITFQYPDAFVHDGWGSDNTKGLISACGYQIIRDLEILDPLGEARDASKHTTSIGISLGEIGNPESPAADYLTITHCRILNATQCVRLVWAPPARHLTLYENVFQARQQGVLLGNVSGVVIRRNIFLPSPAAWTYPAELTGARQVEVSENIAEGTVNGGWRNGFFWNLGGSVEQNLVYNNRTSHDGDKASGNGEAFAYDANGDRLRYLGPSLAATPDTIVLPAGWTDAAAVAGAWVRVVDGKGLGQSRRIVSATAGGANRLQLDVPWDVLPDGTSILAVTNLYWQVYTVDNTVDERRNGNKNAKAGVITPYGSSSDCVVDSNRQYNAEGIMLFTCGKSTAFTANYFTEVRGNRLEGRTAGPGAYGGIFLWYGAEERKPSHVLGYGTVITGNTITDCDYNGKGAISLYPCWSHPTTPVQWKEALIFGNTIAGVPEGIHIHESYAWHTVIGPNTLKDVATPVVDKGTGTVRVGDMAP